MADYGMKVGTNIHLPLTSLYKKEYTLVSTDETMKLVKKGVAASNTTLEHGLTITPAHLTYALLNSDTEAYVDKVSTADSTNSYLSIPFGGKLFYTIYTNNF